MNNYLPPNPNKDLSFVEGDLQTIYLAGGCFWGTQAYIARLYGVAHTLCGYANGHTVQPDYRLVCTGTTGHAEAVKVDYDPSRLSLSTLLREFFKTINPTSLNRQGGDMGSQYRTGIYYVKNADLPVARKVAAEVQKAHSLPIVTEITPLACFYPAEPYHQEYLEKNPGGYCHVDLSLLPGSRQQP